MALLFFFFGSRTIYCRYVRISILTFVNQSRLFVRDNKTGLHKFSNDYETHKANINANIGVAKTYTKVNDKPNDIDNEAIDIMKNDISNQKAPSIKDLFN
ncbi:MAG: hypothetical protein QMB77_05735, partial [Aliarcobacter cryaerophilus]